jgi:hypothetical protein
MGTYQISKCEFLKPESMNKAELRIRPCSSALAGLFQAARPLGDRDFEKFEEIEEIGGFTGTRTLLHGALCLFRRAIHVPGTMFACPPAVRCCRGISIERLILQ